MATIAKTQTRRGVAQYRVLFRVAGKRKSMRLPPGVTQSAANTFAGHVTELETALATNTTPPPATVTWLTGLPGDIRQRLRDAGFSRWLPVELSATLSDLITNYLATRTDVAASTTNNFVQVQTQLCSYFGDGCDVRGIDADLAIQWRDVIAKDYAEATCAKWTKVARQFFAYAVSQGFADINPFAAVRVGSQVNASRLHYVSQDDAAKLIDAAHGDWPLIIALARFGGLRCPSEVVRLDWHNIDWHNARFVVSSPKTAKQGKPSRTVPLFTELAQVLKRYKRAAGRVVARRADSNLRSNMKKIIKRAELNEWPRLFQNMRSSCETELYKRGFAPHVVASWLGHTVRVAQQHYLQVTEDDYRKATE